MTTTTDYRTTVRVNAPADVVFDAITTAGALTAWWSPVTGSGLTGGELRFPMVAGEPPLLIKVNDGNPPGNRPLDGGRVHLHGGLGRYTAHLHDHAPRRR